MKHVIHINKHIIASNAKHGRCEPPITCKNYKENLKGHEVVIYGQDGKVAARVVYQPDKPLSCGARVWIEVKDNKIDVIQRESEYNGVFAKLTTERILKRK